MSSRWAYLISVSLTNETFKQEISNTHWCSLIHYVSPLGGVVSVLTTGPKGCGFDPGKGDGFLRRKKSDAHLPVGWEVKPEGPMS
jgi:hypothetical protein